jgi:hypothetical protein
MGRVPDVFLHVILSCDEARIVITGEAADVENRTEAFFLTQETFNPAEWKFSITDEHVWPPQELTHTWKGSILEHIWSSPRTVRYYFDPENRARGLTPGGSMDSAAALQLTFKTGDPSVRLLLYATPEYPCSVELATKAERCDEILANLEEFTPRLC